MDTPNTYGPDTPDSEIPTRLVITPLHEQRARKLDSLYFPPLSLPLAARAGKAHHAGVLALLIVALHYKLERKDTFALRSTILERVGITSKRWSRLAHALEEAGFIRLNHRTAHRATVTIVDAAFLEWFRE